LSEYKLPIRKIIGVFVPTIVVVLLVWNSIIFLGINQVALIYNPFVETGRAEFTITPAGPGITWKLPWYTSVTLSLAQNTEHMWTEWDEKGIKVKEGGAKGYEKDFPAIECPTVEGLFLYVDCTIRWHINSAKIPELMKTFRGSTWREDYVLPKIRQVTRDASSTMSAIDAYGAKRTTLGERIRSELTKSFERDNWIILDDFNLRKIDFDISFFKSIERKMIAEQELEQAKFEREKLLIQANATAQKLIIEARGMAEAIEIIQSKFKTMTKSEIQAYLYLAYIQALEKGLVQGNKVLIVLPGGIDLTLLLPQITP